MTRFALAFLCCVGLLGCSNKDPTRVIKIPCGQKIISAGHYHANGLTWATRPMLPDEQPTVVTVRHEDVKRPTEIHEFRCAK